MSAVAEVELVVDLPIDEVWALVTDLSRTAGAEIQDHPDRARAILKDRPATLRANMHTTLRAMVRAADATFAPMSGS